jgi:hypothetical protein
MSSRIDHESGVVTVTGCGYSWGAPGHRLYVSGFGVFSIRPRVERELERDSNDWRARLVLSVASHPGNVGVTVLPPAGALEEALENGSVHPSLVEEPRAA